MNPFIVAYDISNDKQRNYLHRLLNNFGKPIQKSIFICWLNNSKLKTLQQKLSKFKSKHFANEDNTNENYIDLCPLNNKNIPQRWQTSKPNLDDFIFE